MAEFDHEKLDVYRVAIDFIALADDIVEALPRGRGYLADQLQRASTSIAANIAEGAGEFSPKEKARFYRAAQGLADRSAAMLTTLIRATLEQVGELLEPPAVYRVS